MLNEDYKILVGVIGNRDLSRQTVKSLMLWQYKRQLPSLLVLGDDTNIEKERNEMVRTAVQEKATHLMFIDDDIVFPYHAIDLLARRQKDIVGGLYYGRVLPRPMAYKDRMTQENIDPEKDKGVFEVDFVGAGFMMIDMKVFQKLDPPFFHFSYDYKRFGVKGDGLNPVGEDAYFCFYAKENGFKTYVDTTFELGHIGRHTYRKLDYQIYKENKELYDRI